MATEREAQTVALETVVGPELVTKLRARTLVEHGGPDGFMCGWNLTLTDSLLHKQAADEIERLRGLIAELLDTELGEFRDGAGSMAPVEDIIGRMADVVRPNAEDHARRSRRVDSLVGPGEEQ